MLNAAVLVLYRCARIAAPRILIGAASPLASLFASTAAQSIVTLVSTFLLCGKIDTLFLIRRELNGLAYLFVA